MISQIIMLYCVKLEWLVYTLREERWRMGAKRIRSEKLRERQYIEWNAKCLENKNSMKAEC